MNTARTEWSRRYQAALIKHLDQGPGANLRPAHGLGRDAEALGLETLDLANAHERAVTTVISPRDSSRTRYSAIKQARAFFAEAAIRIEKTHRAARDADALIHQLNRTLRRRTRESSASTRCVRQNILLRQGAERALEKSGKRRTRLLAELHGLRKRWRKATHARLSKQEGERQRMSRGLRDEIAQDLIAIDLRLFTLKKAVRASAAGLKKEIARTQRLVEESGKRIERFAHEFGIQDGA